MGISINRPGVSADNVAFEASLYAKASRMVPTKQVEFLLPAVQPRARIVDGVQRLVFDQDWPTAPLALGMVMKAGPVNGQTHKAKTYLVPMVDTEGGELISPLRGVPGWDMFFGNETPTSHALRSGVIFHAVYTGKKEPLLSVFKDNAHLVADMYSDLDEGARPLIEAGRRMNDVKGFAIHDLQNYAMQAQDYVQPWDHRVVTVNQGVFDPGGIVQQGVRHPLRDLATIESITFDYYLVSRQNLLHWDMMELALNARTGLSRMPDRVYSDLYGATKP
jgi:hypothetical protein